MNKNLSQSISNHTYSQGLTLIETLVALTVLLTVISASSLAIQSTFQDRRFAAQQSVATYLANDALESIRQQRDNNLIAAAQTNDLSDTFWNNLPEEDYIFVIDDSPSTPVSQRVVYCTLDFAKTPPNNTADTKPSRCPVQVPHENGGYSYGDNYSNSLINNSFRVFHRVLTDDGTKRTVKTDVVWQHRGVTKNLELLNEFANVNPPASGTQINQAAAGETAEIEFSSSMPECSDGDDNDGNGSVDHPADPGCTSADDPVEATYIDGVAPQAPDFTEVINSGNNLTLAPQRQNGGIIDPDQPMEMDGMVAHTITYPLTVISAPNGVDVNSVQPFNPHQYNSSLKEYRIRWRTTNLLTTVGDYEFEYEVVDADGLTDTATINITVQ